MKKNSIEKMIEILKHECDMLTMDEKWFRSQNLKVRAEQSVYAKYRIQDLLAKAELLLKYDTRAITKSRHCANTM